MLSGVVAALEAPELDHPWPEHPTDQGRILLGLFLSVTKSDTYRVLHASVIESGVCNADIHIQLNEEESADLAKELRAWIEKPIYQFIWKKFGWEG